jgi:dienelactone hydrolase
LHLTRAALVACIAACFTANAKPIVETTIRVPVALPAAPGDGKRRDIFVTVVTKGEPGRRPFIVLLHGRGTDAAERAAVGLQAYPANARYFAERGFAVLVPTRAGYGMSGGPDVEYTGDCTSKSYATALNVAVSETRQVLEYARQLPYIDTDHGIVLGESFGGLIAIAAAASDLHGVVGVVNIAGGDGGDSLRHVDQPCRPDQLRDAFERLGHSNRKPTLWMYSSNDRVWGPVYPKQWYAAFRAAGGRGEFVGLPADKNNGHFIFNRNPPAWQPPLEAWLDRLGIPTGR